MKGGFALCILLLGLTFCVFYSLKKVVIWINRKEKRSLFLLKHLLGLSQLRAGKAFRQIRPRSLRVKHEAMFAVLAANEQRRLVLQYRI